MTKLALIPPIPHLGDFRATGAAMMLAQLCEHPKYKQHYRERSLAGDFLVLDNGAFEKGSSVFSAPMLISLAYYIQVNEVIMPDCIMNEQVTFGLNLESVMFMASSIGQLAWNRAGKPRIMIVPQVDPLTQDIDSWDRHARILLQTWHWGAPYLAGHITLGIAKNMNRLHGGWQFLFKEVISELIKEWPIQVHALGLPKSISSMRRLLHENSYIRSVDTAMPFVAALAGQNLRTTDEVARRPKDYFERNLHPSTMPLAQENVEYLLSLFDESLR